MFCVDTSMQYVRPLFITLHSTRIRVILNSVRFYYFFVVLFFFVFFPKYKKNHVFYVWYIREATHVGWLPGRKWTHTIMISLYYCRISEHRTNCVWRHATNAVHSILAFTKCTFFPSDLSTACTSTTDIHVQFAYNSMLLSSSEIADVYSGIGRHVYMHLGNGKYWILLL